MRRSIAATPPPRLQFAAAVAGFAEWLRDPQVFGQQFGPADLAALAQSAGLPDPHGERTELVDLIGLAEALRDGSSRPAP